MARPQIAAVPFFFEHGVGTDIDAPIKDCGGMA
jgi:hypothetical protein